MCILQRINFICLFKWISTFHFRWRILVSNQLCKHGQCCYKVSRNIIWNPESLLCKVSSPRLFPSPPPLFFLLLWKVWFCCLPFVVESFKKIIYSELSLSDKKVGFICCFYFPFKRNVLSLLKCISWNETEIIIMHHTELPFHFYSPAWVFLWSLSGYRKVILRSVLYSSNSTN